MASWQHGKSATWVVWCGSVVVHVADTAWPPGHRAAQTPALTTRYGAHPGAVMRRGCGLSAWVNYVSYPRGATARACALPLVVALRASWAAPPHLRPARPYLPPALRYALHLGGARCRSIHAAPGAVTPLAGCPAPASAQRGRRPARGAPAPSANSVALAPAPALLRPPCLPPMRAGAAAVLVCRRGCGRRVRVSAARWVSVPVRAALLAPAAGAGRALSSGAAAPRPRA